MWALLLITSLVFFIIIGLLYVKMKGDAETKLSECEEESGTKLSECEEESGTKLSECEEESETKLNECEEESETKLNECENNLLAYEEDGYISFTDLEFNRVGTVLTSDEIAATFDENDDGVDEDFKQIVQNNLFHGMKWQQEDQEDLLSYPQGISGTFDSSYIFATWTKNTERDKKVGSKVAVIKNEEQFTNEGDFVPYTWVHLRRSNGSPFNVYAGGCSYVEYTDKDGIFRRVLYVPDSGKPPYCDKGATQSSCMKGQGTFGQNGHAMYCFNLDEIYEENDKYYVNYTFEWTWGTEAAGIYYSPSSIDLVESDDSSATFIVGQYKEQTNGSLSLYRIWLPNTENWIPHGHGEKANSSRLDGALNGTRICLSLPDTAPKLIQGAVYKRNKSLYLSIKESVIKKFGLNHPNIESTCFDTTTSDRGNFTPVSAIFDDGKDALNIEYRFAKDTIDDQPLKQIQDLFFDVSENVAEGKDRIWTSTQNNDETGERYLFYVDIDTDITCTDRPNASVCS